MTRKLVALAVGALALLLMSSTLDPAEARRGGGKGYSGGGKSHHARSWGGSRSFHVHRFARAHSGKHFGHHHRIHKHLGHRHHHHKRRVFVGLPYVYGSYYYADSCYWLRVRALRTGSPYWWSRYRACMYGYDYY